MITRSHLLDPWVTVLRTLGSGFLGLAIAAMLLGPLTWLQLVLTAILMFVIAAGLFAGLAGRARAADAPPKTDLLDEMWNELFEYAALRPALASLTDEARAAIRAEWAALLAYHAKKAPKS